ncbi:SufB/SufD family protein [Alteromonas sp. ASW11-130]|uniref:SufB/SufD family protein n=1 Tax=Alteromonas sp. ASW11-130 TaxID=3015775 RepID=UPI00224194DC|nr:SufD family Fe-S cluster assembly protein [Alteromonas sp. ASW11-130]MCW8091340.1 SufD family Fe-S cluster assembly protein [Alteromonas sp. ASW11-130]
MSQWLEKVIDVAQGNQDFLAPARQQAVSKLQQAGWPSQRAEQWRFTSLAPLKDRAFTQAKADTVVSAPEITGLDAIDIVFTNGELTTDLAALTLPEGLRIVSFAGANAQQQEDIQTLFGRIKPERHVFGQVNDALSRQGVMIDVADNIEISSVIRLINLSSVDSDNHTRALIKLGNNSKAKVMELGQGEHDSMNTAMAEYSIGDHACLEHYRFAFYTVNAKAVGGSHFKLGEAANLNSTVVGYGSPLSRLDIDIWHAAENAFAKLNAIYLLAEGEMFDLHTCIEHAKPNGTSEENARGIIGDGARAVFNGRIHIHRDAQKTLAEMNNRNLLLSRRAMINTKPELEIYADDVKCAHGATVAEIEGSELFYLLSRGISRQRAMVMLNFGFIRELVNDIPNEAIAQWLLPQLSERFARMEVK